MGHLDLIGLSLWSCAPISFFFHKSRDHGLQRAISIFLKVNKCLKLVLGRRSECRLRRFNRSWWWGAEKLHLVFSEGICQFDLHSIMNQILLFLGEALQHVIFLLSECFRYLFQLVPHLFHFGAT